MTDYDPFEEEDEERRRAEEAWLKRVRAENKARDEERIYSAIIAIGFLILIPGCLWGWTFWGYLQTGEWPPLTIRSLTKVHFESEMVGLANIVNWFLDLWIGVYPMVIGCFAALGLTTD